MKFKKLPTRLLAGCFSALLAAGAASVNAEPFKSSDYLGPPSTKAGSKKAPTAAQDRAVERTREVVKMVDDLYKTAIVLITEHYVNDPATLSAATASKAIFEAMRQKGWQETKLLGFTGVLINPSANAPQDDFEKKAEQKLLEGEASYEEVVNENGKRYLRMATAVPVVMEKCVMCHANFEDKEGAIGALSYKIAVLE